MDKQVRLQTIKSLFTQYKIYDREDTHTPTMDECLTLILITQKLPYACSLFPLIIAKQPLNNVYMYVCFT